MKPTFEIDIAFCRPGLIVLDNSGALYTSQVFGTTCYQASARGFFVPLDETLPEFCPEPVEDALRRLLIDSPYLTPRQADDVDLLLRSYGETSFLRVDRDMLAESGEAWVHVEVIAGDNCPLGGRGPWKAILVWPNSD